MTNKETCEYIFDEIFLKDRDNTRNVFLCGKALSETNSIRRLFYDTVKDNPRFNIVFPEWIFPDLLASPDYNLLVLEKELVDHVDAVVIPLESSATFAELGAFASFDGLRPKLIVVNDRQFINSKSFVNLGPIALIKATSKDNIILFDQVSPALVNRITHRIDNLGKTHDPSIANLFNLSRFVLYLIAIFQPVTRAFLAELLEEFQNGIDLKYVDPSIHILIQKKNISAPLSGGERRFILTEVGHQYFYEALIPRLGLTKPFNRLRARQIGERNRKLNKLVMGTTRWGSVLA